MLSERFDRTRLLRDAPKVEVSRSWLRRSAATLANGAGRGAREMA
jgi:hypothetical protein